MGKSATLHRGASLTEGGLMSTEGIPEHPLRRDLHALRNMGHRSGLSHVRAELATHASLRRARRCGDCCCRRDRRRRGEGGRLARRLRALPFTMTVSIPAVELNPKFVVVLLLRLAVSRTRRTSIVARAKMKRLSGERPRQDRDTRPAARRSRERSSRSSTNSTRCERPLRRPARRNRGPPQAVRALPRPPADLPRSWQA